jgi:hypothetical protein
MTRSLRTLLLWILVLALPMQGAVASTMRTCGASGAMTTLHVQPENEVPTNLHADHKGMHDHHVGMDHEDESKQNHHAKHSHSSCNACCISAAVIATGIDWSSSTRPGLDPAAAPLALFTGYIPSGLERPPRFSS